MDRRTDTSDGSGAASPTVVTERQDGDDLMADTDEPTQILGTWRLSALLPDRPPSRPQPTGVPSRTKRTTRSTRFPALPADSIGSPRDSFAFSRSAPAPVSPGADDWTSAEGGVYSPPRSPSRRRTSLRRSRPVPDGRPMAPCSAREPTPGPPREIRRSLIRRRPSSPPARSPRPSPRPHSCGIHPARTHLALVPGRNFCARAPTRRPRLRRDARRQREAAEGPGRPRRRGRRPAAPGRAAAAEEIGPALGAAGPPDHRPGGALVGDEVQLRGVPGRVRHLVHCGQRDLRHTVDAWRVHLAPARRAERHV